MRKQAENGPRTTVSLDVWGFTALSDTALTLHGGERVAHTSLGEVMFKGIVSSIAVAGLLMGCAGSEPVIEEAPVAELAGDTGKADGIRFNIKDYFKHTRILPLEDLSNRVATLGTDKVNDALGAVPFVDIAIGETQVFGLEDGSEDGVEYASLDGLVSGLTSRFGENAFVTRINSMRSQHLARSGDRFYAESDFDLDLPGDFAFTTDVGDFDVALGFKPRSRLRARTVFAHGSSIGALLTQPLKTIREFRGFVIPRGFADLQTMLPGESIALEGEASVGFNVGANLPVFSFDPINYLVLTARFHLGARVSTEGLLDVQMIRGEGNDLYLDVGLKNAKNRRFRAAIDSGYGLHGIPSILEIDIAGNEYSLGMLAERLIRSRLDRSGLLDFGLDATRSSLEERITINRFRLDLKASDPRVEAGLKQAVGGDLRLLQTLADRADSGVEELVSLERDVNRRKRHFGAHIASMRFFNTTEESAGTIRVASGDSAHTILFRELEEHTGRFFRDWGFRRLVVTDQHWKDGVYQGAQTNLRLAVSESDRFTNRDQVLDHVDSALLSVLDFETAYENVTRAFEELQHEIEDRCQECRNDDDILCEREYDRCLDSLATAQDLIDWRARLADLADDVRDDLDDRPFDREFNTGGDLAGALLDLKLAISAVRESPAALADTTGRTSMLSDARFSQKGLDDLFRNVDETLFDIRLRQVLTMIISKRSRDYDRKYDRALRWLDGESGKISDMVDIYSRARKAYLTVDDATRIGIGGQRVGDGAFVIVPHPDTKEPILQSLAEQKGVIAAKMVDEMVERGEGLNLLQSILRLVTLGIARPNGFESHHLVAYTLLSLVEPDDREWLIAMDFEEEDFADVHIYTRGARGDQLIGAGDFDLDLLLSE